MRVRIPTLRRHRAGASPGAVRSGVAAIARVEKVDWLVGAGHLAPASIDLVYADPPFNTGSEKRSPPGARRVNGRASRAAYADAWEDTGGYIAWLRERLAATLPALKPTGLVALHCDYRACHHIRLLLDELLGADRFVNHLIWSYGLGGSSARRFARKHDDILLYALDPRRYYFDAPRVPATSVRMRGLTKKATDVLDVPSINNMARERTGYPTQKPVTLLEMLVRACCPPCGTVLDPCCGSGTTLVAACASGRGAIGFDVNATAVRITRQRLDDARGGRAGQPPHPG